MISIIIPVHNTAKYLKKCLNSLLNQTWQEFEIILIDDGSTDNSDDICDNYAKKNQNICVIHQTCMGVSYARNNGIEHAKGEFITFIDSDDWVSNDYIENIILPVINNKLDFIISGMIDTYNDNSKNIEHILPDSGILSFSDAKDYYQIMTTKLMTSPVGKIYRKSIIDKYNIRFNTTLSFAEDKEFNLMYMKYAQNGCSISYRGYHYRREILDSLTKKKHKDVFNTYCRQWQILKSNFYDKGYLNISYIDAMLVNELFNIINDHIYHTTIYKTPIETSTHIDFNFLKLHKAKIEDKKWKKDFIISNNFYYLKIIYKIRLAFK